MSHQEAEQEARQKEKFYGGTQWEKSVYAAVALRAAQAREEAENRLFEMLTTTGVSGPTMKIRMEPIPELPRGGVCGDSRLMGNEESLHIGPASYDIVIDQMRDAKCPPRAKSFIESLQECWDKMDAAKPAVTQSFDYDVWIPLDEEDDAYVDIRVLL